MEGMVNRYLGELATALRRLPVSRRDQLVAEIREHITQLRAERPPVDRSDMEALLNRVGLPEDIAAVALEGADESDEVLTVTPAAPPPRHSRRNVGLVAAALAVAVILAVSIAALTSGSSRSAFGVERIAFALPRVATVPPVPLSPVVLLTVPDVVGLGQSAAQYVDAASGFTTAFVAAPSANVPVGLVSSESPSSGSLVRRGSTIALTVSSGPSN
jgi:hypothetical protein